MRRSNQIFSVLFTIAASVLLIQGHWDRATFAVVVVIFIEVRAIRENM
jgi:hypothetical protein